MVHDWKLPVATESTLPAMVISLKFKIRSPGTTTTPHSASCLSEEETFDARRSSAAAHNWRRSWVLFWFQ